MLRIECLSDCARALVGDKVPKDPVGHSDLGLVDATLAVAGASSGISLANKAIAMTAFPRRSAALNAAAWTTAGCAVTHLPTKGKK